ncbi:MAG: CTP synthase [Candidatus Nomurabacteria bacterium]|jgi:CTP synthase|nr:CTP synthase [Candidatus Nomurabacteria bacterium]
MKQKPTKYIFVTGGVLSGVGKGITAASIGAILQAKGFKVSIQKFDPYYSVDAGLLNPGKHGECFVTKDGAETDLDLGHYERFLDIETTNSCISTSGKIMQKIIERERAGKFGGNEVQLVPHVTGLIQDTVEQVAAEFGSDIHIIEIGGTVGDFEGVHFIEALREFPNRVGRENCFYAHVVYIPYLVTSHEFKTKPAQNSIHDLRTFGIIPNMIVARVDKMGPNSIANKIATFTGVLEEDVILFPNAETVYKVPLNALKSGIMRPLSKLTGDETPPDMSDWAELNRKAGKKYAKTVSVGLVAKYVSNTDTYISVTEALKAAAFGNDVNLDLRWINAETACDEDFAAVDGLLVPGGFGMRGIEGKVAAANYALAHDKPYLGLCLGLQVAVIAAARRAGLSRANSEEFDKETPENVIYIMEGQRGKESTGGTMRLGDYPARLKQGSKTAEIYGALDLVERHRHRYEVNQKFLPEIAQGGVEVSGTSPDGKLVEFIESPALRFFQATQAHPEFRSRPMRSHPLFFEFIKSLKTD